MSKLHVNSTNSQSNKQESLSKTRGITDIPLNDIPEYLIKDDFRMLKPYIDIYGMELNKLFEVNKIKPCNDKVKIDFELTKNQYKKNDVLLSFVVGFRGRSRKALASLESLLRNVKLSDNIEVIIVEQLSDELLDRSLLFRNNRVLPYKVSYFKLDAHSNEWERETVLNFGVSKARGKYVAIWSVCFLCGNQFINKLLEYVKQVDFSRNIFSVTAYESHTVNQIDKYQGYDNMWVYEREKIIDNMLPSCNDLNQQLGLPILHSIYLDKNLYVIHMSHQKEMYNRYTNLVLSESNANSPEYYILKVFNNSAKWVEINNFNKELPDENVTEYINTNQPINQDGVYLLMALQSSVDWICVDNIETLILDKLSPTNMEYPKKDGIYILAIHDKNRYWIELIE